MATDSVTPPPDSLTWPTLFRLAGMSEGQRKRALRSRKEIGLDLEDNEEDVALRRALDRELELLSLLELRFQGGDSAKKEEISGIQSFQRLIRESPAFVHYLNSHLFFQVRFAAWHLRTAVTDPANKDVHTFNERPAALPPPPACQGVTAEAIAEALYQFEEMPRTPGENFARMFRADQLRHGEVEKFELWLRGLYWNAEGGQDFRAVARDLYQWAVRRADFYSDLEKKPDRKDLPDWRRDAWNEGIWNITNPWAARCALMDLYWLAQILRAEVSPRGRVTYKSDHSWLRYLPAIPELTDSDDPNTPPCTKDRILWIEEILRSVFDFACDLMQNAVGITEYNAEYEAAKATPDEFPDPWWTNDWRATFDQELTEVGCQRRERLDEAKPDDDGTCPEGPPPKEDNGSSGRDGNYWSERIVSGRRPENLIGLAFSGGGIRSATFGLGVLQGLRDLELLNQVDYLSTVSGGGYIGAWLLGNVRRTRYWLDRKTSWEESIGHLRRYSKYLAPQSGLLSADTWVIWGTWIRNAFLIQLTTVAWLATLFVIAMVSKRVFEYAGSHCTDTVRWVLGLVCAALAIIILVDLWRPSRRRGEHRLAIGMAMLGSFLGASLLWATVNAHDYSGTGHYSEILTSLILNSHYQVILLVLFVALLFLAIFSCLGRAFKPVVVLVILLSAVLSLAVMHLTLSGVVYLFELWAACGQAEFGWYAYVFGPVLVLLAVSLGIIVFIGLIGRASDDWKREWWTRFGSWLAIYGTAGMALNLAAVFGPVWVDKLFDLPWESVKWGAVISWVGSTIAGLLAGNSGKTKGGGPGSSKILEWVAVIGGIVFITGGVLAVSSLLRFTMVAIWMDASLENWWDNLNYLLTHSVFSDLAVSCLTILPMKPAELTMLALAGCGLIFSWRFNLNTFGLNQFYRNRLVRCYLGATRWQPGWRKPQGFTGFDDEDDIPLTDLRFNARQGGLNFRGPFPIVNCSLNLGGSSDLTVHTRQSASFTLTPLTAGADRRKVGYASMTRGFAMGPKLGKAISISGAAVSPNMGYSTSPLVAVLLTMFNARLGWWFPNPAKGGWKKDSPAFGLSYLISEFLGLADEGRDFVNVSDGGHFENLGIYELIRRGAKVIIASDAECDPELAFGSLGNMIRICETDFGAKIDIDVTSLRRQAEANRSVAHCAVGKIRYSNGSHGHLIYLKATITGDENADIQQYLSGHPDFPHQSTANQFFTEDQFESYRRLGRHVAKITFRAAKPAANMVALAVKLGDLWVPAGFSSADFVSHTTALDRIWERFRTSAGLTQLLGELFANLPVAGAPVAPDKEELCACLELLQLMENVFIDLRLDDFWDHPDNRGWAILFRMWAKSPRFRGAWNQTRRTFGIRFEYFCKKRLSLDIDEPVVRIERDLTEDESVDN